MGALVTRALSFWGLYWITGPQRDHNILSSFVIETPKKGPLILLDTPKSVEHTPYVYDVCIIHI